MSTIADQVKASLQIVKAVADTIRELKEVPSGTLYANLMGSLSLQQYSQVISILKRTGLVVESNNVLKWVEPNHDNDTSSKSDRV